MNRAQMRRTPLQLVCGVLVLTGGLFAGTAGATTEDFKLVASDRGGNDQYGFSVALSVDGTTAIVGSRFADCTIGNACGAAYVLRNDGSGWVEEAKLVASHPEQFASFGVAVALSASGTTALVGARDENCEAGVDCGAAYVFERHGGEWSQTARIILPVRNLFDGFGTDVSLSNSGNVALIGSGFQRCDAGIDCGAAYVYENRAGSWEQVARLAASDLGRDWAFGFNVKLSGNGKTAIIGAPLADCSLGINCGAGYLYEDQAGTWVEVAKLVPANLRAGDQAGAPVTISRDGTTIMLGALGIDCAAGINCGGAFVFTRGEDGTFQEDTTLSASDGAVFSLLGTVSVSDDGTTALIGARGDSCAAGVFCGSAYVFRRSGVVWSEVAKLTASDAAQDDQLGISTAISGDGTIGLVGSRTDDCDAGLQCGAVYGFAPLP